MAKINKVAKSFRLPQLPSVSDIVKLYKLTAIKKLSQNFLLDMNVNHKIVRAAGIEKDSFVMEIGPGPGGLTRSCIEHGAKEIVLIEKDLRFMNGLQLLADAVSEDVRVKIFHDDALRFPMGQHVNNKYKTEWESDELPNAHLIGNLPFGVATQMLFKLLLKISDRNGVFSIGRVPMTLLFQKEFGERMMCPPGFKERSRVSVMTQAYCDVQIPFIIANTAFVPTPKVNAACVKLIPLVKPKIKCQFDIVSRVVKAIFQFKNKRWIIGAYTLFPINKYPEFKFKFDSLCKVSHDKLPTELDMAEIDEICLAYAEIARIFPEILNFEHRIHTDL